MAQSPKVDDSGKRIPDKRFEPDEQLFRRFMRQAMSPTRPYIDLSAISLPDLSVNRSKYSRASDVVDDFPDFGVAAFLVSEIPPSQVYRGTTQFEFRAVHKPLKKNYAHSEVQCFRNGEHFSWSRDDIDDEVEEMHYRWRYRLQQVLKVVIGPPEPRDSF